MSLPLSRRVRIGIRRRWWSSGTKGFGALGVLWLVTEFGLATFGELNEWIAENRTWYLASAMLLFLITFLYHSTERVQVGFTIPTTGNRLIIIYGDIFNQRDVHLFIPVNEFFDTQLGQIVSPTSVHGGFIRQYYGGNGDQFRAQVDQQLLNLPNETVQRANGRTAKYEIGTTVRLPIGAEQAFLTVTATTDPVTSKASTSVDMLWQALQSAYRHFRDYSGGTEIAMPLVGNGRSNLNLSPQHILRLIVLSLVTFARAEGLGANVRVVLPEACFDYIDLAEIERDWKANGL